MPTLEVSTTHHVVAPTLSPEEQVKSLDDLKAEYYECIRNLDSATIGRLQAGQLSQHELVLSPKLCRATALWQAISARTAAQQA